MSPWLARALAEKKDGLPCANSAVSANRPQIGGVPASIGTNDTNGTAPSISEEWQAYFDERAGIREFDGELTRSDAEALALQDTIAALGPRPTGEFSPSDRRGR
jgi:hypothetical protein